MIEQIEVLIELQGVEAEIRKTNALLETMPRRLESLEEEKRTLQEAVEAGSVEVADWRKQYREQEAESKVLLNRISKSREKLHQVKTNKEYTSSLKEIDELKHQHSKLEDAMLECLDRIEEAESSLKERREEMESQTADLDEAAEALQQEIARTREAAESLNAQAGAVAEKVPADLMKVYQRVKSQQARGVAVARVAGAVCQGCNMNIPPQLYNEVQRRDQLYFCPNCQRIIYWEPDF